MKIEPSLQENEGHIQHMEHTATKAEAQKHQDNVVPAHVERNVPLLDMRVPKEIAAL